MSFEINTIPHIESPRHDPFEYIQQLRDFRLEGHTPIASSWISHDAAKAAQQTLLSDNDLPALLVAQEYFAPLHSSGGWQKRLEQANLRLLNHDPNDFIPSAYSLPRQGDAGILHYSLAKHLSYFMGLDRTYQNRGVVRGFIRNPDTFGSDEIGVFYEEWKQFITLAYQHGARPSIDYSAPLVMRGLPELTSALADHPTQNPATLIERFTTNGAQFKKLLEPPKAVLQRELTFGEKRSGIEGIINFGNFGAAAVHELLDDAAQSFAPTDREEKVRKRMANILDTYGDILFTEDAESGQIVTVNDVDELRLIVHGMLAQTEEYAAAKYGKPITNVWGPGRIGTDYAKKITPPSFYGKLLNPRGVLLPVDEQFIKKYFTNEYEEKSRLDKSSVKRVALIVDMHSTGRGKVGESLIEVVTYSRDADDQFNRAHYASVRGQASGSKVADLYNDETSTKALSILRDALKRPILAGLPTLGKKR